ncbi:YncE family protein [Bizionia sediminis]|uniref:YncE family protein n=1 Tax=Bizionia sediminis TaxID=1737064 RepID=A0ABW5KPW4_9FLAO
MKNRIKFLTFIMVSAFVLSACSSDDINDLERPATLGAYENGLLVIAEGGSSISGSVSFISNDFSTTENTIFSNTNAEELGSYVQSIGFNGGLAYIVVQNNNIHVVNRYTFLKDATISSGLNLPRYMAFANGKGYVTNWGDGFDPTDDFLAVVNLQTNAVETTIPMSEGPEQVLVHDNKLYISHKGGYGSNNIISVMDLSSNIINTITVNDVPDEMFINSAGDLVVLSEGNLAWTGNESTASITTINLTTNSVTQTLAFADGLHPEQMAYDNGNIYYTLNGAIYKMSDSATSLPSSPLINLGNITTYGMSVKNDKLFVTDAKDYVSLGDLIVYDLNTNDKIHTFEVGLIASKIYFN